MNKWLKDPAPSTPSGYGTNLTKWLKHWQFNVKILLFMYLIMLLKINKINTFWNMTGGIDDGNSPDMTVRLRQTIKMGTAALEDHSSCQGLLYYLPKYTHTHMCFKYRNTVAHTPFYSAVLSGWTGGPVALQHHAGPTRRDQQWLNTQEWTMSRDRYFHVFRHTHRHTHTGH